MMAVPVGRLTDREIETLPENWRTDTVLLDIARDNCVNKPSWCDDAATYQLDG